jgi:acyl-CoA synthetase (AMP-forming)/AMP-acid ligase II
LCTGDLAYLLDGELVICGRIKDVIIVGGRNVFPEDIERAVGSLDGVRAGNVIAFGVDGYKGKETVVVVAEVKTDDPDSVRQAIHHAALEVSGLPPRDVMLRMSIVASLGGVHGPGHDRDDGGDDDESGQCGRQMAPCVGIHVRHMDRHATDRCVCRVREPS